MNEFIQIRKDKGLYKKILKSGEGENIMAGDKVSINIKGIDELSNVLQDFTCLEHTVDSYFIPRGCNEGLKTMKKGEISVFVMRADYGSLEEKIKSTSDVIYSIEVIDILK
jgi:FKBP-type peptidyl-prolyl cis-trans isomerase